MPKKKAPQKHITIGLSTSALFDMRESNKIFEKACAKNDLSIYERYMDRHIDSPLKPGHAFEFVKAIDTLNKAVGTTLVDIILLSRNSLETGNRALNSCAHYKLPFSGASFTNGQDIHDYLPAYSVDWLITDREDDAIKAHNMGIASCALRSPLLHQKSLSSEFNPAAAKKAIHLVWDLDRVLLSHHSDEFFTQEGAGPYLKHEKRLAKEEIPDGPFTDIARILGSLTALFNDRDDGLAIVSSALTMRGGVASHRAMNSLREKGVVFNGESHFSGGMNWKDGECVPKPIRKDQILEIMKKRYPDHAFLFLDDSAGTIEKSQKVVPSGLVPRGAGLALGETTPKL